MPSTRQLLTLAALSGLLSYGLLCLAGNVPAWLPLPADVFRYAPGFVFGLMALQLAAQLPLRRAGLVLAAGLTWILMFQLASGLVTEQEQSTVLACGVAGGLGAWLISLSVRLLAPRRLSLLAMLMAFVAGTLGGCVIGEGLLMPDESWWLHILLIAGFFAWQAGVAGSLLLVDELGEHEAHA
ncbi:MAG TPA: hypothetical protein VNJ47_04400 [Nevskiales bacterium]|nr:hypothetical protein [Nevskiales bacterium]